MLRSTAITKELAVIERKLRETTNETLKNALKKKQARLKDELKDASKSAPQLAKTLLAQREEIKALPKSDFNDLIRRLSKKPEYSFLKTMGKSTIRTDLERPAKPVGWRFKGRGNYETPTKAQIAKGKRSGTVYREVRPLRSDVSRIVRLEDGGGVSREIFNLSFNYNPGNLSNEDAEKIVKQYTNDWKHNNDFDNVSFYVFNLTKDKADELKALLKMEDVYNIEIQKSNYADGGGVGESKKEDINECKKLVKAFCKEYGERFKLNEKEIMSKVSYQAYLGRGASVFVGLKVSSNIDNLKVGEIKPTMGYVILESDINPNGVSKEIGIKRTYTINFVVKGSQRKRGGRSEETTFFKAYQYGITIDEVIEKFDTKVVYDLFPLEYKSELKLAMGQAMEDGGVVGQEIVIDYQGDEYKGVISKITDDGDYIVDTDNGRTVLAQKEMDVISLGAMKKKPMTTDRKKRFGFFEDGGKMAFGGLIDENNVSTGGILRMEELSPNETLDEFINNAKYIVSSLEDEGFEKDEIYTFLAHMMVQNTGGGVNGMSTVNEIARLSGLRSIAVGEWADKNNVNLTMVLKDLKSKKIKGTDLMTAIVGKPGNKYSTEMITQYAK